MSPSKSLSLVACVGILGISGCIGEGLGGPDGTDHAGSPTYGDWQSSWLEPRVVEFGAVFSPTLIVDAFRAGGEPVIAITDAGTIIISSHPGYTHFHPTPASPELLLASQTQVYLWRSTDGGASFEHVSLLPAESPATSGPRGAGQGVSDPDLTVDANGRIWLTDLEALAAASVSWSDDDGVTWLMGNDLASGGAIDRQWLASIGDTVYFTGNYFSPPVWGAADPATMAQNDVIASQDGITWESRGSTPCNGDFVADPVRGRLYQACGDGFVFSDDGAVTWDRAQGAPVGCGLCEPAVDAAGTVYLAGVEEGNVTVSYTKDDGATWAEPRDVQAYFPELADSATIWPWVSAGSEGRFAVTFLGAPNATSRQDADAQWHAYTVLFVNATGSTEIYPLKLTTEPLHTGAVCVGTVCQATTAVSDASDRRLGDFFETTISPDGFLHIAYSNTGAFPDHGVSHVAYHRQLSGPSLVVGEVAAGFPTQG